MFFPKVENHARQRRRNADADVDDEELVDRSRVVGGRPLAVHHVLVLLLSMRLLLAHVHDRV